MVKASGLHPEDHLSESDRAYRSFHKGNLFKSGRAYNIIMNEKCEYLKNRILKEHNLSPSRCGITANNDSFLAYVNEVKKSILKKNRKIRELYIEVDEESICFVFLGEILNDDLGPSRTIIRSYSINNVEKAYKDIEAVIIDNLLGPIV